MFSIEPFTAVITVFRFKWYTYLNTDGDFRAVLFIAIYQFSTAVILFFFFIYIHKSYYSYIIRITYSLNDKLISGNYNINIRKEIFVYLEEK